METKDLHIAPVSELADRTHKKTTAFLWNAAVYHCGEGGIVLASAAHSLAARRGALATGLKRLICSKHIMAFFTRVLASELADTCKKTTAFLWNAAVYHCGEGGSRTYTFKKYHKIANY